MLKCSLSISPISRNVSKFVSVDKPLVEDAILNTVHAMSDINNINEFKDI